MEIEYRAWAEDPYHPGCYQLDGRVHTQYGTLKMGAYAPYEIRFNGELTINRVAYLVTFSLMLYPDGTIDNECRYGTPSGYIDAHTASYPFKRPTESAGDKLHALRDELKEVLPRYIFYDATAMVEHNILQHAKETMDARHQEAMEARRRYEQVREMMARESFQGYGEPKS